MLSTQKIRPTGKAIRFSMLVGWDLRWKDMMMATLTTDRYMLSRSHERKVLSLAQWSRASEDSLGKSKGAKIGRERNRWEVEELTTVRRALLRGNMDLLVYDDSSSVQRLECLSY